MSENFRSIPHAKAEANTVLRPNGVRLKIYRLIGPVQDGPVLLFGHANGIAAGSYLHLLTALARRATVFTFDARGHGGSSAPATNVEADYSLENFTSDLEAIAQTVRDETGNAPFYYAAHSLNAAAALRLGARAGRVPWHDCVLFEPPVFPPMAHPLRALAEERTQRVAKRARNRRSRWPSPEAFVEAQKKKLLFGRFETGRLLDYAQANLEPTGEGDQKLACPPEIEAAIFSAHQNAITYDGLIDFPMPVRFVASEPDPDGGANWIARIAPEIAKRVSGSTLHVVKDTSHLLPFEATARVRDHILAMLP